MYKVTLTLSLSFLGRCAIQQKWPAGKKTGHSEGQSHRNFAGGCRKSLSNYQLKNLFLHTGVECLRTKLGVHCVSSSLNHSATTGTDLALLPCSQVFPPSVQTIV